MAKKKQTGWKRDDTGPWKTVVFEQTDGFKGDQRLYRVVGLTNTIEPLIGKMLPASEVSEMCSLQKFTVIIGDRT